MEKLAQKVEEAYRCIQEQRMQGMPLLNPALKVEGLGFRQIAGATVGVLITPWSMSLLRFAAADVLPEGQRGSRHLPVGWIEFIGVHEEALGAFESASLFSPMFQFADQEVARVVAFESLRTVLGGGSQPVVARDSLPRPAPGPLANAYRHRDQDFDRRSVLRGRFLKANDGAR